MNYKKLLIPVDGSETSRRALARAIELSRLCQSQLMILYVADLNKQLSSLERISTGGFITSDLKDEGYQVLTDIVREVPPEIMVKPIVGIGAPVEVITELAKTLEIDLIIMGCRGLSTFKQLVMGSVSQGVLQHAECAVMTVR